jgi:glutamate synthase domain-containing protein 3
LNQCNKGMVDLERVDHPSDIEELRVMIEKHWQVTGSLVARHVLDTFTASVGRFIKVMPIDYKRALELLAPDRARDRANVDTA